MSYRMNKEIHTILVKSQKKSFENLSAKVAYIMHKIFIHE